MNFPIHKNKNTEMHLYATPEIIKFSDYPCNTEPPNNIKRALCNKLSPLQGTSHISASSLSTSSRVLNKLHLIKCKNASITGTYGAHDSDGFPFWNTTLSRGCEKKHPFLWWHSMQSTQSKIRG